MRSLVTATLLLSFLASAHAQSDTEKLQIAIAAAGSVEKLLAKSAQDLSATLPRALGPNLELRSVSASGLTLKNVAVFTNVPESRNFDQSQLRLLAGTVAVCGSTLGQLIQKHNAVVEYEYRARSEEVVFRQIINSEACKSATNR